MQGNRVYKSNMKFPKDVLRFLYWIFFKPISFRSWVSQLDPVMGNTAALFTGALDRSARSFKHLGLFYVLVVPWLLATGTGLMLTWLGMDVNWLRLIFTLSAAIALSLTLSVDFGIAFLLPFSIAVTLLSSTSFAAGLVVFFSLMLGTAYGLSGNRARWGLTAAVVYGVFFSILMGALPGVAIGAAFLVGYFRIIFYIVEALLSWSLGNLAAQGDAISLWQFHPVQWDELIWFPLPGLDKHLLAIKRQDDLAAQAAIHQVQESFRQRWAAQQMLERQGS